MTSSRRTRYPILLASAAVLLGSGLAVDLLRGSGSQAAENFAAPPAASGASGPVAHETYAWRHVAVGGGGFITGLAFDPHGETRLARTDVYGAYIWTGDRWHQLVNAASMPPGDRHQNGAADGVYEIAVAPSDPDRLYMAIQGWVYRSLDRGRSWTRADVGGPFPLAFDANSSFRMYGPFIAVDPTNPDHILLGTPSAGLWRSIDGARRWTRVQDVPESAIIATKAGDLTPARRAPGALIWFEPGSGGRRIWVMSPGHGMFISEDGGAHFQPLPAAKGSGPALLRRGGFAPDGSFFGVDSIGRAVWVYRHDSWTNLSLAVGGPEPRNYAAIAINPHDGTIFVFDEGGRGARSMDGGRSWIRFVHKAVVGDGDPPWLHVADQSYFATADVEFDPVKPGRMWAGAGTGVFFADPALDGLLVRWTSQARGIEELVTNDIAQAPGMPPAFAAWDFGIHVKSDLDRYSTTYGPRERVIIAAQQVAWTPADPAFLVTNASDTRIGCCTEDGQTILAGFSMDGGRSWARFATLPRPPGTKPEDPWRMAFGMIAVSADSIDNIIWAPSFNRSPFYTMDRGKSWSRVVLPGEVLPNTGSHEAYYLPRKTLAADRVLPGVFYLVHSGEGANKGLAGLWRTADGGAHWARVFSGEIAPNSRFAAKLRAVPGKAGELFFTSGVMEGADTVLRRSRDGGRSWTTLAGVDHVDDVGFGMAARGASYPTIFISGRIGGDYGIWRSIDDGARWQKLTDFPDGTLDQVSVVAGDPNVFGRVYLGYKGSGWVHGEPAPCHRDAQPSQGGGECRLVQ